MHQVYSHNLGCQEYVSLRSFAKLAHVNVTHGTLLDHQSTTEYCDAASDVLLTLRMNENIDINMILEKKNLL